MPDSLVKCDYCGEDAKLVKGTKIYPHRSDLAHLNFHYCDNGHSPAYVGCHKQHPKYSPDGTTPLGRLADAELRAAKSAAHAAFDPLWRDKGVFKSRGEAYGWLACEMGLPKSECHIGMFDVEQCEQAKDIVLRRKLEL